MRKYGILLAFPVLALACKKEDATTANLPSGNFMTATINGSYWNATEISRVATGGDTVKFTGSRNPSKPIAIQVTINHYHGTGSYVLNDTANTAIYTENAADFRSVSGTLNVSIDDLAQVTASFQFTCDDGNGVLKTVTNGGLNINK